MLDTFSHAFSWVCGQNPDHTWMPGGLALPCFQRCIGLYVGAGVAALLHAVLKPQPTARFLQLHGLFLLLMVPFGFHWLPQGEWLRAWTGVLFGFGLVAFLASAFHTIGRTNGDEVCSAGFQTCCVADFQVGSALANSRRPRVLKPAIQQTGKSALPLRPCETREILELGLTLSARASDSETMGSARPRRVVCGVPPNTVVSLSDLHPTMPEKSAVESRRRDGDPATAGRDAAAPHSPGYWLGLALILLAVPTLGGWGGRGSAYVWSSLAAFGAVVLAALALANAGLAVASLARWLRHRMLQVRA